MVGRLFDDKRSSVSICRTYNLDETTMTENTNDYNGWSNYETWTVGLWLDNERESYEYWRELTREHRSNAVSCSQVAEGTWTADEAEVFNLANQLKEEVNAGSPLQESSMYADLLCAALSEVNWSEIAEHYLADLREEEDPVFGPIISAYTRAQAIADGVLIDVSEMAREAGIKYPTTITSTAWAAYVRVPKGVTGQDEKGRLWDILNMYCFAVKTSKKRECVLRFEVLVRNDNTKPKSVTLKAIVGPGDTSAPVVTIMLPEED